MQLSADQLAEFTTALKASDRKLPHDDRRRTPRMDVRSRVIVSLIGEGRRQPPQMMRLRDLSPRGVCLMHTEDFERGRQFILTLPRDGQAPVNILCTTVYSRSAAGRLRLIGAEFLCTMSSNGGIKTKQSVEKEEADEARIRSRMLD